jgi:hypothetical protein
MRDSRRKAPRKPRLNGCGAVPFRNLLPESRISMARWPPNTKGLAAASHSNSIARTAAFHGNLGRVSPTPNDGSWRQAALAEDVCGRRLSADCGRRGVSQNPADFSPKIGGPNCCRLCENCGGLRSPGCLVGACARIRLCASRRRCQSVDCPCVFCRRQRWSAGGVRLRPRRRCSRLRL